MRVKAHWFRDESAKAPEEGAGAVGFIAFGVAHSTLGWMRKAAAAARGSRGWRSHS